MTEFEYREEESGIFGKISRPVADIYFKGEDGKEIVSFMYIDSGADIVLIPRQIGESIGLKVNEKDEIKEIGGIGSNKIPIIIKEAKIRIGDVTLSARIAWSLIEEVPPLLGRIDVFDKFNVNFKQKDKGKPDSFPISTCFHSADNPQAHEGNNVDKKIIFEFNK